ncbi:hypothetical protein, partial [Bradyrhizobium sp. Mp27]|uniref:hypothetical protein n=1 Tax=Bradyrhizobium sp. Mp27 TaxID=3042157 RepID=UPI00248CB20E
NASGGSSSSSSLLIRSKNPRRCQAENPLKLLSEFAGQALKIDLAKSNPTVIIFSMERSFLCGAY